MNDGFTDVDTFLAEPIFTDTVTINVPAGHVADILVLTKDGAARVSVTEAGTMTIVGDFRITGSAKGAGGSFGFGLNTITPAADTDVTLTATEAESAEQTLVTGSWTADHNVIVPTETGGFFLFRNTTAFIATVKTAAGSGIAVPSNRSAVLWCGGANVIGGLLATA